MSIQAHRQFLTITINHAIHWVFPKEDPTCDHWIGADTPLAHTVTILNHTSPERVVQKLRWWSLPFTLKSLAIMKAKCLPQYTQPAYVQTRCAQTRIFNLSREYTEPWLQSHTACESQSYLT
ncbi:hypothetical protein ACTXT7_006171 [Hymenolepis weldensis]